MSSLARRAHPFTPGAVAMAVIALAVLLPTRSETIALYLTTIVVCILVGAGKGIRLSIAVAAPFWILLLVVHGLLGADGRAPMPWGGSYSTVGLAWAIEQGARLGAIIAASLAFATTFDPHRFLQAAIARRWPFALAFLLVAALDAASRFNQQATRLREAQRTRGLRVRGSLLVRARALPALVFPLLLATITEADDHALALETRGLTLTGPRTATDPPDDSTLDLLIRWCALVLILTATALRFAR